MKKNIVTLLTLVMLACAFTGCGKTDAPDASTEDSSVVNLMDMYSVEDPKDVAYDQRTVLYMPVLESSDHYADGARHLFSVLYGKEGKGVYMYNVEVYEEAEQAAAYKEQAQIGEVDGAVYITESNADFFVEMEAFIPDLQAMIDNLMASGMMEID